MVVIDATTAVDAALVPGRLEQLAKHGPVAPALLWSETTSTLRALSWREQLAGAEAAAALERLLEAKIERRSPRQLYEEAWRISEQLGWAKTYDAEYVALARLLDCPLVTLDGRLARGAGHLVEILGPRDLR